MILQWVGAVLLIFLSIPFTMLNYANFAYGRHLIKPSEISGMDNPVAAYANTIAAHTPAKQPIVMIVPLNGTPAFTDHSSYKNAAVAQAVLMRIPDHPKYLLLSEGYTGDPCFSGARITMELFGLQEGYNPAQDITVLLEEQATTTFENISFSTDILKKQFSNQHVTIVVAGMSDIPVPAFPLETGHGARAYMLATSAWHKLPTVHMLGFLPTNLIDSTLTNYPPRYNNLTMALASLGALGLPRFDRSDMRQAQIQCE